MLIQHTPTLETKTCGQCGVEKPFSAFHKRGDRPEGTPIGPTFFHAHCKECRRQTRRMNIARPCVQCGIAFKPLSRTAQFCSNRCAKLTRYPRVARACPQCGVVVSRKPSSPRQFCSGSCASRYRETANRLAAGIRDDEKRCPRCNETLPLSAFARSNATPRGRACYCTPCQKAYNAANPRRREYRKIWQTKHPGHDKAKRLERMYGLTAHDAKVLLDKQAGRCAICDEARALHVDHDHATGRVRGLLCRSCNLGLGQLGDTVERIRAALTYLEPRRPGVGI